MSERKKPQKSSLSQARSPDDIGSHWDEHSLADHWDETREADFEVRLRQRSITLDPEVYDQIEAHARARGLMPEILVNLWLKEHLRKEEQA